MKGRSYARAKLTQLLRDLDDYTPGEFWRQMSRIAEGATGEAGAEYLKRENQILKANIAGLMFAHGGNPQITAAEQIRALSDEVEQLTSERHQQDLAAHQMRATISELATHLDLLESRARQSDQISWGRV